MQLATRHVRGRGEGSGAWWFAGRESRRGGVERNECSTDRAGMSVWMEGLSKE